MDLVAGKAQHVDAKGLDIERLPTGGLHGISVKDDGSLLLLSYGVNAPADLGDVLNGADLVVGEHHAHEDRVLRDGSRHGVRIHQSPVVHR